MVGTDSKPEMTVSIADNFRKIMEEYGDEMIFMFVAGIIVGILISCLFCFFRKLYKELNRNNNDIIYKPEDQEKTAEPSQTQNISRENYFFLVGCIGFAIIMCIAAAIMAN